MSLIVNRSGNPDESAVTVLSSNANTTTNAVVADIDAFGAPTIDSELQAPETEYANGDFLSNSINTPSIIHDSGQARDYKIEFSGTIIASGLGLIGSFVGVRVVSNLGQTFTGGTRFFELGVSGGESALCGFYFPIYGRIADGEVLNFELSSNSAGDLILSDIIIFSQRIRPA